MSWGATLDRSDFMPASDEREVVGPEEDPGASRGEFSPQSVREIAHDLNNALATVTGYAQLLEGQPDWPPHLARQLQTLAHDAARAAALAQELLILSRAADSPLGAPATIAGTDAASTWSGAGLLARSGLGQPEVAGEGAEILVVDDEEPVITLIAEVLAMDGHRVTPAFNGAEALAWTQMKSFDLIISDVRMPAVGGPAFFEILQTERPDLLRRVLFVTGDTVSLSTRVFLAGTHRPVLAKPFDPDRLRHMVRECLDEAS